jgi:DHA1 family multidrug resistance protein-like MFS transporter
MFKRKKTKLREDKITPDFVPMIRIVFWNSLGFFFFWFLIPYVSLQLLGVDKFELGIAFAFQTFGGLLSSPLVGYLTDRVSKKLLVLIGSFGRGAAYAVMYIGILIISMPIFTAGLFVLGFFVGFFWSPLYALMSEKSHKSYRSSAFGKQGGMLGKGNFVGSILSFIIFGLANLFTPGNRLIIYSPLLLFTASNIYAGIIFNRQVDEFLTYEIHKGENNSMDEIKNNSQKSETIGENDQIVSKFTLGFVIGFFILIIAFMASNLNQTIGPPFFQAYLIEELKIDNAVLVMLIYFPSQIFSLLLSPKIGKIADRINPIIGIAFVSGFGSLITWLIINSNNGITFSIMLLLDSTLGWAGGLILQNVLSRVSKGHRGKIFGFSQWMSFLGAILGPLIGGFVYQNIGSKFPFIISIFVELSLIPLYIIAITTLRKYMAEKLE